MKLISHGVFIGRQCRWGIRGQCILHMWFLPTRVALPLLLRDSTAYKKQTIRSIWGKHVEL